jgi:DNA-binding phage protein
MMCETSFMASRYAMLDNTVVRKSGRLTKDRAKSLVAAGLQRAVAKLGKDEVALAAGCSSRCIEKALGHDTLPSIETLFNALGADATIADELLAAYGFRLVPLQCQAANDLATAAGLGHAGAELAAAWADGKRDHPELFRFVDLIRPHLPAINALIQEADQIRGAA